MDTQIHQTTVTNYSTLIQYKCGRTLEVHMLPDGTFKINFCFSREDWEADFDVKPERTSLNEVEIKIEHKR